jgi:predicted xylose isomerase-like sugar epimerase
MEIISLWKLESVQNNDTEYLAADMVHEMFHVHQKQKGETRFADDLTLLAYPDNINNYQLKIAEIKLLVNAFYEKNITAFNQFINIRNIRKKLIGDIIFHEYRAEISEGMAEYAGLVSLQQINSPKYKIRLEDHISKLINQKDLIFDTRRMAYYSGAVLCSTLKLLDIDFYHDLSVERTLFEIIDKNSNNFLTEYQNYMENK